MYFNKPKKCKSTFQVIEQPESFASLTYTTTQFPLSQPKNFLPAKFKPISGGRRLFGSPDRALLSGLPPPTQPWSAK